MESLPSQGNVQVRGTRGSAEERAELSDQIVRIGACRELRRGSVNARIGCTGVVGRVREEHTPSGRNTQTHTQTKCFGVGGQECRL
jgi:hypothetical protein